MWVPGPLWGRGLGVASFPTLCTGSGEKRGGRGWRLLEAEEVGRRAWQTSSCSSQRKDSLSHSQHPGSINRGEDSYWSSLGHMTTSDESSGWEKVVQWLARPGSCSRPEARGQAAVTGSPVDSPARGAAILPGKTVRSPYKAAGQAQRVLPTTLSFTL